jgi:hypothetical protein
MVSQFCSAPRLLRLARRESVDEFGYTGGRAWTAVLQIRVVGAQHQWPARAACAAGQDGRASLAI